MNYEYDVFISYRRNLTLGKWVPDTFISAFRDYLSEELPQDARIFLDIDGIHAGDDWGKRIHQSLVRSKVLVPVWIPSYFRREWCVRELAVFLHREKNENLGPGGLILPIQLHDGEHFPGYAMKIQMEDFRSFNVTPLNPDTALHTEFHKKLQGWVRDVQKAIARAPNWDDAWLNFEDYCEQPFQELQLATPQMTQAPHL